MTTPGSLIVKLPSQYKNFDITNPITFIPKKKILTSGEPLQGTMERTYGKWDSSLAGKYRYEIIHREYIDVPVDDIRVGKTHITSPVDTVVGTGNLQGAQFTQKLIGYKPGEYHMRITPIIDSSAPAPEASITDTLFYIAGAESSIRDTTLRVIPERTVYSYGDTARVLVQVPFTGSYILLTKEKGGVFDKEYFYLSGNTFTREIKVDDTMMPNAYIGVVALHPGTGSENTRSYAVGYGEIVTNISDKKSHLTIDTNKKTYKNRENVQVNLTLTDKS